MTQEQIESLRQDFLEWSGGFGPDSDQQIFLYVELARPGDVPPGEAQEVLVEWMEKLARD